MTTKKKPTGFKAQCQCGVIIGALDYTRTDRKESGKIMGQWLHDGCMIIPQFDSGWQTTVNFCQCDR